MRNYAENGELCGIMRRTGNCAISHSPHLNVASALVGVEFNFKVVPTTHVGAWLLSLRDVHVQMENTLYHARQLSYSPIDSLTVSNLKYYLKYSVQKTKARTKSSF